jgi:Glycosyl hydrolases family 16
VALLERIRRVPDESPFELEFDEDFSAPELDQGRWIAHYLPHWTTPERSAARYDVRPGELRLRIDADQPTWRVEDGEMRVSNLQTGAYAGQHRHRPDMAVATPTPTRRLYTPSAGRAEAVIRATADPTCMTAFWLLGFEEDSPDASGEICVAELFGHAIGPGRARVKIGVKAHGDPRLHTDMEEVELPIDATGRHTYAAEWDAGGVRFFVDDALVRTVAQRIGYPLQLMVDLFEFPAGPKRDPAAYPKTVGVSAVRGYRHAGA